MGWTEIILGALTLLGGCAWVNLRFNLNIVVPLQQRVQKLESQIERLHDAIEGINSCPYRTECPVLGRMRQQPEGDK